MSESFLFLLLPPGPISLKLSCGSFSPPTRPLSCACDLTRLAITRGSAAPTFSLFQRLPAPPFLPPQIHPWRRAQRPRRGGSQVPCRGNKGSSHGSEVYHRSSASGHGTPPGEVGSSWIFSSSSLSLSLSHLDGLGGAGVSAPLDGSLHGRATWPGGAETSARQDQLPIGEGLHSPTSRVEELSFW